jgi:hypothetical protein
VPPRAPRVAASLLLALLALPACALFGGRLGPRPPEGVRPAPQDRPRVEAWLAGTRAEMDQRRSVRAFGKLRVASERGKGSVKAVVVAQRPDRLRLETLNLLGQTQTLLVVDGDSFAYFEGGAIERGRTERDVLRLRLGLDLEPREAVALLLAAPSWPAEPPRQVWAVIAGDAEAAPVAQGAASEEGPALGGERRAEFAERSVRFAADGSIRSVAALDPGGMARWRADFAGWHAVAGGQYPTQLSFDFPATELRAELTVDDVEVNAELDPQLFRAGKEP